MKMWTKVLVPVLMFGMVGIADAKGTGKAHAGLRGKIVSVAADGTSITIQASKKAGGQQMTVTTDLAKTAVTIDGTTGKKVTDLEVGEKVTVDPTTGTASLITAKHHHQKKTKVAA